MAPSLVKTVEVPVQSAVSNWVTSDFEVILQILRLGVS